VGISCPQRELDATPARPVLTALIGGDSGLAAGNATGRAARPPAARDVPYSPLMRIPGPRSGDGVRDVYTVVQ
jgi:hypothetical protein